MPAHGYGGIDVGAMQYFFSHYSYGVSVIVCVGSTEYDKSEMDDKRGKNKMPDS